MFDGEKEREEKEREREKKVEGEIPANVESKRRRDPALSERRQTASRTVDGKRETERGDWRTGFIQPPFKNSGTAALGKIINARADDRRWVA